MITSVPEKRLTTPPEYNPSITVSLIARIFMGRVLFIKIGKIKYHQKYGCSKIDYKSFGSFSRNNSSLKKNNAFR